MDYHGRLRELELCNLEIRKEYMIIYAWQQNEEINEILTQELSQNSVEVVKKVPNKHIREPSNKDGETLMYLHKEIIQEKTTGNEY